MNKISVTPWWRSPAVAAWVLSAASFITAQVGVLPEGWRKAALVVAAVLTAAGGLLNRLIAINAGNQASNLGPGANPPPSA